MDPYVELDFYTDPTSPWWSYQTTVNASAGKQAEWEINQSVPLNSLVESDISKGKQDKGVTLDSLRVRVKDKNSLRKDVLIGKGVLTVEELKNQIAGEWNSTTLQIKNKKGKVSGQVVLTTRYRQPSSPPLSALPETNSTVPEISHSSDLAPIFLISLQRSVYDPAILSRKERLERICLKYGVTYRDSPSNEDHDTEVSYVLLLSAASMPVPVAAEEKRQTLTSLLECAKELQNLQPMLSSSSPSTPVSVLV